MHLSPRSVLCDGQADAMDIGYAATGDGREDYSEEDVHAVSASTRCYICDGWRHFSRECPPLLTGLAKVARKEPARLGAKEKVVASWDSEAAAKAVCSRVCVSSVGQRANECTGRVAWSIDDCCRGQQRRP